MIALLSVPNRGLNTLYKIYLEVKLLEPLQNFSQLTLRVSLQWDVTEKKKPIQKEKKLKKLRACTSNFR